MDDLNIAEIPYDSGVVHQRYARYMSDDGTRWIRHGLFRSYHPNGSLACEGMYEHGAESGQWRDYHENGQLAAEGHYLNGQQSGNWRFWDSAGNEERDSL